MRLKQVVEIESVLRVIKMEIKYVGPKPLISHSGIDFEYSKEDKYTYLNVIAQLIKAIDYDAIEEKTYIYHADTKRFNDDEIIQIFKKYDSEILNKAEMRTQETYDDIKQDIIAAQHNKILNQEDITILIENITLMKAYNLQRAYNKSIYFSAINTLADILKKDNIDYVIAPMFAKFAHVFHSVEGVFVNKNFPIEPNLEIFTENNELFVKLDVVTL